MICKLSPLFCALLACQISAVKLDDGTFWHVTDMHHDVYYDDTKSSTGVCPSAMGRGTLDAGPFGDYRCDSPWKLIDSAISEMRYINPNPDFIIWTGDDVLHTANEDQDLSEDIVFGIIKNQSLLLREKFPNTPIYPALGNHDMFPDAQFPAGEDFDTNALMSKVADTWCSLFLGDAECKQFTAGGFYSSTLSSNPPVTLISLNSNLWYSNNHVTDGTGDPTNHFAWFENELKSAEETESKIVIIGHVTPGYMELTKSWIWFYENYNREYIRLVTKYSNVIIGQFFGHHHTDTFRIVHDIVTGHAVSSIFIAPGVTPWMTTIPNIHNGASNPGIRHFDFDKEAFKPMDYTQYYLDLKVANEEGVADWKKEYRFSEAYNLPDISLPNMVTLAQSLSEDSSVMKKYIEYNSVSYNNEKCDDECQLFHLCAINHLDSDLYKHCVSSGGVKNEEKWEFAFLLLLLVFTL